MNIKPAGCAMAVLAGLCFALLSQSGAFCQQAGPYAFPALKHDVSPPLREIKPAPAVPGPPRLRVMHRLWAQPPKIAPYQPDPALQTLRGPTISATAGLNFDGICNTVDPATCPQSYAQAYASKLIAIPPDTNGAVGTREFVQWVNYAFAAFDKSTGRKVLDPVPGNALWNGFAPCEANNDGDPIVQFDKAARRWVLMQPVFTKPYALCIAVSTSDKFTDSYNRYLFNPYVFEPTTYFPDYPKLGIWPDGYYVSIDLYTGQGFGGNLKGSMVCAFDRLAMLAGNTSPKMQCFQLSSDFPHLLPSDLDGSTPPPSDSPNYFLNFEANSPNPNSLNLWKFHVDFATPSNSTFTGPTNIPVAAFNEACGGGICVPQAGTNRRLDSLGDRLMYRLAYRNFGDHESLVVNHSVTAGSSVGVRWYEIRDPRSCSLQNPGSCNPKSCVYQQGTFAPDANFRWMGSVAMDKAGDIAVGYSKSNSSTTHPSIYFTGRVPVLTKDACNMLEDETRIIDGTGSQTNASNWGDYSSMSIDPVDDCTFWYTTEYYFKQNSNYNWNTRIASFKFQTCK